MRTILTLVGLGIAIVAIGCSNWHDRLIPIAAYDLKCPEGQLNATLLTKGVAAVEGCGHRAKYVDACDRGGCKWILNNAE